VRQTSTRPVSSRAKNCRYCNTELSLTQSVAGDVCDNINCRLSWREDFYNTESLRKQQLLEEERAFEQKATSYLNKLLHSNKIPAGNNPSIGIVPANQKEITVLPEHRIQEFKQYLRQCIEDACARKQNNPADLQSDPHTTDSLVNTDSEYERVALIQGCTTCKGFCCLKGGETRAYQDAENMLNYVRQNENKSIDTILNEYLGYIPELTYENSCVYHTEAGCTLPREMRAEICNKHLCKGLRKFKQEFVNNNPDPFFIVAEDTHTIVRSSLVTDSMKIIDFGQYSKNLVK